MTAYYNEIDPYAAQWLRNLIDAGHIAPGVVDERSIEDVRPDEIAGYAQCHFFAGIGVWSLALRNAGWPDDRPVWTGSCPCQPFSIAAVAWERKGFDDPRHLSPAWLDLINECSPDVVFGEQVASKDGVNWLDDLFDSLERNAYACGAAVVTAAGAGADHIRARTYFVANSLRTRRSRHQHIERVSQPARTPLAQLGDSTARIRTALAGNYAGLLPRYESTVGVGRSRTKGYGNAINAGAAQIWIETVMDCLPCEV
jgi:DNA (cytosine-5)-methyltransferase 1